METNGSGFAAVPTDWLTTTADYNPDDTVSYSLQGSSVWNGTSCSYIYWQPWPYSYSPSITLTLEEVNHLRKAARKDAKLKAILENFTPYIAVEVAFS